MYIFFSLLFYLYFVNTKHVWEGQGTLIRYLFISGFNLAHLLV